MSLPLVPDPVDPELVDACGNSPRALCEFVWEQTANEGLSAFTDWFVARPLTIVVILLVTWIVTRIVRKVIRRTAYHVVAEPDLGTARLQHVVRRRVGSTRSTPAPDLDVLLRDPRRHARATAISTVLGSTATVVLWTLALLLVLGEVDIDLAPIIAGAGIAGVALGFGAQSLVKDCLAGLFILIEDQFGIGDIVDLGEAQGAVERVSLRATVVRGPDGTVWHVPNGVVMRVGNRSQSWAVAVIDVPVAHGSDLAEVTGFIETAATEVAAAPDLAALILEPPEVLGVEAFAADSLTIRVIVKTTPGSQLVVQRALRQRVKELFDEHGVEIPSQLPWMRGAGDLGGAPSA